MIKFGPSGCCEQFAQLGYTKTIQAAAWLKSLNLDCFEYSFGRGVQIKEDTARAIGEEFSACGIELSVHAPYFINLATVEEDKAENNHRYIFDSFAALSAFGGKRCVIHPGSPLKAARSDAMGVLMRRLERVALLKEQYGYNDSYLCIETMGKVAQLGTLDEVIAMCSLHDTFIPCVDFGHLNARDCGIYHNKDDYKRTIDTLIEGVGIDKCNMMHVHFSKIQYTSKGELRHLTFEDDVFGPPYEPLLEVLSDYKLSPYIVCESAGTQTADALTMKNYYYSYSN